MAVASARWEVPLPKAGPDPRRRRSPVDKLIIHPKDIQSESVEPSKTISSSGRWGWEAKELLEEEEKEKLEWAGVQFRRQLNWRGSLRRAWC
jgi:hypothetical protein